MDRVAFRSVSELQERYLTHGQPVVVQGYVDSWPALGKITPDFLASEWGSHELPVVTMHDGDYANGVVSNVPLRDYLQNIGAMNPGTSIDEDGHPEVTQYMAQVPVAQYLPELLKDIERPPFFPQETHSSTVVYVGGELFSQLHYHPGGSATLCMLHGQKRVRLFSPDQSRYLYAHPWYSQVPHMSRTRHSVPDPREFPDFGKAKYVEVTVTAGDLLFIPIYWWHSVENEDVSISVVTFWSRGWRSLFLPPAGARAPYFYRPVRKLFDVVKEAISNLGARA